MGSANYAVSAGYSTRSSNYAVCAGYTMGSSNYAVGAGYTMGSSNYAVSAGYSTRHTHRRADTSSTSGINSECESAK
jgi:hypothetical protein